MRFFNFMTALILIYWLLSATVARASDLMIFDVRRPIALKNDEVTFKDFYISGGSEAGLAAGMLINVVRKVPLYDSYSNRSAGELLVKVARVKIVAAQKGLAVARLHSSISRETNPILEDYFIMIGDQLDLTSAAADKRAKADGDEESDEAPASKPTADVAKPEPELETAAEAVRTSVQTVKMTVNSTEFSSEMAPPQPVPAPVLQ